MPSGRRRARVVLAVGLVLLAGCGEGDEQAAVIRYRTGVDLAATRSASTTEGVLRVDLIDYTSVDGTRVPALFAVPTDRPPEGCLVVVPGFGAPKEALPQLRQGLARLRLATFSIDARNVGARGGPEQALKAVGTPEGVRAMLLGTVADLRVGLDWLERRPECHHDIGVLGTSFGGSVATHVAAQDRRIRAAVITSVGATYKQTIIMRPRAAETVPNLPNYVAAGATDAAVLAHAVKILGPYDLDRWIGRIAPRPLLLINGRHDPIVAPGDALQLAAAARPPKTLLYFDGGHDPYANEPGNREVVVTATRFLVANLKLSGAG